MLFVFFYIAYISEKFGSVSHTETKIPSGDAEKYWSTSFLALIKINKIQIVGPLTHGRTD